MVSCIAKFVRLCLFAEQLFALRFYQLFACIRSRRHNSVQQVGCECPLARHQVEARRSCLSAGGEKLPRSCLQRDVRPPGCAGRSRAWVWQLPHRCCACPNICGCVPSSRIFPADQQPGLLSRRHHPDDCGRERHADSLGSGQLPPPGHRLAAPRPNLEPGIQPRGGQPAGLGWRGPHGAHLECQAPGGSGGRGRRGGGSGGQAARQRSGGGPSSGAAAAGGQGTPGQWCRRGGSRSGRQQRALRAAVHLEDEADTRLWPAVHDPQPAPGQRGAHAAAAAAPHVRAREMAGCLC